MNQTLELVRFSPRSTELQPAVAVSQLDAARSALLASVFEALDRSQIAYCVTHGYRDLPEVIASDVDFIVEPSQLRRVREALCQIGGSGRLVQWIDASACWAAVAADGAPGVPAIVQLHFSRAFEMAGQVFYSAPEILATRRRYRNFWVPSNKIEFACICINRAVKKLFRPEHIRQLVALLKNDYSGCASEFRCFFNHQSAIKLLDALQSDDGSFPPPSSIGVPVAPSALNGVIDRACRRTSKWSRRVTRWARPANGLHVVFLGPDGVGKSTVIDAVRTAIVPAFLRTDYMTFAPSLIPGPLQPKKETPHQLAPRSLPASLLKAAWWLVCYTAGYYATVRPVAARASLILNHRYLLDARVDPRRYRYGGPQFLLKLIWWVAPKPDLILLLDAPAEVIQARKREVAPAETARQRNAYRAVISRLANAHVIDTNRSLPVVADEVNQIILSSMCQRTKRAAGMGGK